MSNRTVTIPVDQLDSFARALRRLEAARYALVGIGADKEINVWPVEEPILDTQGELHAVLIALDPAHAEVAVTPAADAPDILVENHGSIVLLRPATAAGREWLEANCDRSGYQPFAGGTLLCEPRYVADIVAGARGAGLEVR